MKRKSSLLALLLISCMAFGLIAVTADDDDDKKDETKVVVKVGGSGVDSSDSKNRVAEYNSIKSSAEAGFYLKHLGRDTQISAFAKYLNSDDIQGGIIADLDRVVRVKATYNEFLHRLDHDPLTNLKAVKSPKVTRSTDMDPFGEYAMNYSDLNISGKVKHPDIPGLALTMTFREQNRTGHKQTRTLSHCANCHIVGQDTYIDQVIRNYAVGVDFATGDLTISAEFQGSEFRENGDTPMHQYMDVRHPSKDVPVFNDRASFSDVDGLLPHNMLPDSKKWKAKVNATLANKELGVASAGFVYSVAENEYTANEMTFTSFRGSYFKRLNKELSIKARGLYYTIENDDYYVDINEPVAVAGGYPGQTFQDHYGYNPDYNRLSAYNRDVMQLDADIAYRFAPKTRLNAAYRLKTVDRDHYSVTEGGDTKTTHNRFKVDLISRPMKNTRVNAHFLFENIDQPFVYVNAAGTPNVDSPIVPAPFTPGAVQYFELYDARIIDMSNEPSQIMELKASASQKLAKGFSINGSFQWKQEKNDNLDFYEWTKDRLAINASSWFAFSPEFYGTVSYSYKDEKTESLFVLPIFDG